MSGRFEGDEALERLKALKRGRIIFALMTIALGVVLLVYSDDVLTMFSQIIGGILIARVRRLYRCGRRLDLYQSGRYGGPAAQDHGCPDHSQRLF